MDAIIVPIRDKIVEKFSQVWEKISYVPKDALNADSGINDLFNSVSTQMDARHAVTKKIFDEAKDKLKIEINTLFEEKDFTEKIKDIIIVSLKSIAFSLAFTISAAMRIVTEASKLLNDTVILFPVALIATSILIPITSLFNEAVAASFKKFHMIGTDIDINKILEGEKEKIDIETYKTKTNKLIDDLNPLIEKLNDKIEKFNEGIEKSKNEKANNNINNNQQPAQQNKLPQIDNLNKVENNLKEEEEFQNLEKAINKAKKSAEDALNIHDFSKHENIEQLKEAINELSGLREKIKGANALNNITNNNN